jgi:hypothetical protein
MQQKRNLLAIKKASHWASAFLLIILKRRELLV